LTLDAKSLAAALTALAVVGLLLAERSRSQPGKWLAKPAASCGFLAVAWLAGAPQHSYGQTMLVGLALCALGDVLLIPLGTGAAFLCGIASFALGHAVYACAFLMRSVHVVASSLALVGMLGVVIVVLRWLGPRLPADMRLPVRVYMAVIASMVAAAVGVGASTGETSIAIGAVAFAVSDLSVARDRFVRAELQNVLWGLPLYYFAQLLLAFSCASALP
jgi:uncharacterized membrane protein YhhN